MSENPSQECDVVMKGGITSGIVYPLALCQLRKTYRFRSLGGSSAGAIAAAGAAAAEYARQTEAAGPHVASANARAAETPPSVGFDRLEMLPDMLAEEHKGKTRLLRLFQPNKALEPLYKLAVAFVGNDPLWKKALIGVTVALATWKLLWFSFIIPVGAALLLFVLQVQRPDALVIRVLAMCGVVAMWLVAASGLVWVGLKRQLRAFEKNFYGLTTGLPETNTQDGLSTFLANEFDQIAGIASAERALPSGEQRPLTFGDLAAHDIDLRMLTTNMSFSRPYELPFTNRLFFYDSEELRRILPARVVDAMDDTSSSFAVDAEGRSCDWATQAARTLRPFPPSDSLPVVAAVRMSLSFPMLISAVPLYAAERDDTPTESASEPTRYRRVWFTDGGLSSNLPIHFFDSPVPSRPTFAINLRQSDELVDEGTRVLMPAKNDEHWRPVWTHFEGIGAFLSRLLGTTREWNDAVQLPLPGNRDRIVTIVHRATEGGLNLKMSPETMKNMSKLGRQAADTIEERFSLDNHRWIRFRVAIKHWVTAAGKMNTQLVQSERTQPISKFIGEPPKLGGAEVYALRGEPAKQAAHHTLSLVEEVAAEYADTSHPFGKDGRGTPKPETELRVLPKL